MRGERARVVRLVLLLAPFSLFACFCPQTPPPPTDTCALPATGSVDQVAVAATRLLADGFGTGAGNDEVPPRPLAENDRLWLVTGGQGAQMVGVRLVFTGADVPGCVAQDTQVMVNGALVARNRENVATYPLADGGRASKTLWLPGAFGSQALLQTTAAGRSFSVAVLTASTDACAGVGRCPCARALQCQCAEGLGDAGAALWDAAMRCQREACDAGVGCVPPALTPDGVCGPQVVACQADLF